MRKGNVFTSVCQEFCSWGEVYTPKQTDTPRQTATPSGGKIMFYTCLQFYSGGVLSQHALQVTRPTARWSLRGLARSTPRGKVEGSGWGVSRPTPRGVPGPTPGGFQVHMGGCIPACTETDPPADGYCCRQYAFYWNAFLFFF